MLWKFITFPMFHTLALEMIQNIFDIVVMKNNFLFQTFNVH